MTKKKIAHKKSSPKRSVRRTPRAEKGSNGVQPAPVDAEIKRAAERAGIKVAPPSSVLVSRDQLETWFHQLEKVSEEAILAAPRRVPWIGTGYEPAINAFDRARRIRGEIEALLEAGGAS
jgi:hypothetical protein